MLDEHDIRKILDAIAEDLRIPGIAAALCFEDRTLFASSGVASVDTNTLLSPTSRFEISCLMKFLVSLVTLALVDAGDINLDTPVAEFLPEISRPKSGGETEITIRHLLSHTSGSHGLDISDPRVRWGLTWHDFVVRFVASKQLFPPGQVFNYEHSEHVILGRILDRVTNFSGARLVEQMILGPLGLKVGNVRRDKQDARVYTAGHVLSVATGTYVPAEVPPFGRFWTSSLPDLTLSLPDLARIGFQLMPREGQPALGWASPSVLEMLCRSEIKLPQCVSSDGRGERTPLNFGLGCADYGGGQWGHNGSVLGQTCGLRFMPDANLAIVVGVNAWSPYARDIALRRIIEAATVTVPASWRGLSLPPFPVHSILNDFTMQEVVGHYLGSYLGEVAVALEDNVLRCDVGPPGKRQRTFRIASAEPDLLTIKSNAPVSVGFFPVANNREATLYLGMHGYKKV